MGASDLSPVPEEIVSLYDDETATSGAGDLVYAPPGQS